VALSSISLRGLRNLEPTIIEFDRGANYLFGPNGAGKTNLLEAIHYLAIGRSFRRCPDSEMLGFGKDVLLVSGTDASGERAEIRFDGREKRLLRNDIPVERLSEYFGWLPVVVLLLEDIELVRGAPGMRRSFLDLAIAKADRRVTADYADYIDGPVADRQPKSEGRSEESGATGDRLKATGERHSGEWSYIALMAEYRRAVSQYNRLLERSAVSREPLAELAAWEEEVVRTGTPVYGARIAKVGELLEGAARHHERLTGRGAAFSYWSSIAPGGTRSEIVEGGQSPALKAPQSGTVPATSVMSGRGSFVRIEVEDTGAGIPEKYLDKVFEPYFTHGKQDGTGLGLALAKKIVEDHRGRMEIHSREGEGTTVAIILPAEKEPG